MEKHHRRPWAVVTGLSALLILVAQAAFADFDHSHKLWNAVLQADVNDKGRVNYKAIRDEAKFKEYLQQLAGVTEAEFNAWNRNQKLAYWINAYNAYTIKTILDHYPIKAGGLARFRFPANSIRQISGVWDKLTFKAGGRQITLGDIEHKELRAKMKEPRIHFAIVCASIGCPNLSNKAYTAAGVDAELSAAAKRFITNTEKVRLDYRKETLYLSKIFDWFSSDFAKFKTVSAYGSQNGIVSFVSNHLPQSKQLFIKRNKLKIKWLDYDWSLNEQ